jgi:hypothetical protein
MDDNKWMAAGYAKRRSSANGEGRQQQTAKDHNEK